MLLSNKEQNIDKTTTQMTQLHNTLKQDPTYDSHPTTQDHKHVAALQTKMRVFKNELKTVQNDLEKAFEKIMFPQTKPSSQIEEIDNNFKKDQKVEK